MYPNNVNSRPINMGAGSSIGAIRTIRKQFFNTLGETVRANDAEKVRTFSLDLWRRKEVLIPDEKRQIFAQFNCSDLQEGVAHALVLLILENQPFICEKVIDGQSLIGKALTLFKEEGRDVLLPLVLGIMMVQCHDFLQLDPMGRMCLKVADESGQGGETEIRWSTEGDIFVGNFVNDQLNGDGILWNMEQGFCYK